MSYEVKPALLEAEFMLNNLDPNSGFLSNVNTDGDCIKVRYLEAGHALKQIQNRQFSTSTSHS